MTENKGKRNYWIENISENARNRVQDILAVEEPLEIRLAYFEGREVVQKNLAVTMRTPGHDIDLALGFLLTEGIISAASDVVKAEYLPHKSQLSKGNRLLIGLAKRVDFDFKKLERNFYTSSSCGVCGKASIEAVNTSCDFEVFDNQLFVSSDVVVSLPDKLRQSQVLFEDTGGIHAAGLFTAAADLSLLREDVGRHNAVDKVVGAALRKDYLPLENSILQVSGRLSFELVQKAFVAGISIVSAVGAPSSLAVDLARKNGMTLLGFVRNKRFNVYTGAHRIKTKV